MCGICGVFRTDGGDVDLHRVETMRDVMEARGPDDAGLVSGPGFALGHRRLSVIDLSPAGHQPMGNEDGRVQIAFNGEIFNHHELRGELLAAGHTFRSRTDTEVLIHGYEQWGLEELLRRIRGFFAFAIADARRGEIHLARDPLGKKPLFMRRSPRELAFASSARALHAGLESTPEVDPAAVESLLFHQYVPGPQTIFSGVEKLQPGHALSLGRDGEPRLIRYWKPDFMHPEPGISDEEWLERIEHQLTEAIRRRLVADVPVGVLLSGGVDSSLVTALAARLTPGLKTFSVAVPDPTLDERRYARMVAERYGTDHTEFLIQGDVREGLTTLVASMGEPLADASAVNAFAIARLARESVTVILTGDGGDEVFGGYSYFLAYQRASRLRGLLPGPVQRPMAAVGDRMRSGPAPLRRAGTFLRMAAAPIEETIGGYGYAAGRSELFTDAMIERFGGRSPRDAHRRTLAETKGPVIDRIMQAHMLTRLPDDYLAKVDYATMAVGLEARNPFLDLDVVELGMRAPAETRFRGGTPKALLRRLARKHLPVETVDRKKKGFEAPIALWLREWTDLVDDLILGPQVEARGWFRRPTLERLVREHRSGIDQSCRLWGLLILELWMRLTVEGTLHPGEAL